MNIRFNSKQIFKVFFIASFFLSDLSAREISAKKKSNYACSDNIRIYASYRSNEDQLLNQGSLLKFNVFDSNVGDGIRITQTLNVFNIESTGRYQINYGIASADPSSTVGINLVLNRKGEDSIKDRLFNGSSSIILHLEAGDTIRFISQANNTSLLHSYTTGDSTFMTNTAYVTFVKLLPKRN